MENQPVTWKQLIYIFEGGLALWVVWDILSYCVKYGRHPPRG